MMRITTTLLLLATALAVAPGFADAQAPTITAPSNGQIFPAGPDYATDVLHDPWDFSNVEDVAPHPDDYLNWQESTAARSVGPSAFLTAVPGRFKATSVNGDPALGLLYQGTSQTVLTGRVGSRYPIETAKYRKLAFRMKVTNATGGGSAPHVNWFFGTKPVAAGGLGTATAPQFAANGERVYLIDLPNDFYQGTPYTANPRVVGLRLDPTSDTGATIELDWVRLTGADGAPGSPGMMTVTTTGCSGARTVDVVDGAVTTRVLSDSSNSGSFNYGIFPPGPYTLRVGCNGTSVDSPFVINDPPHVNVVKPSALGSQDYATTVLGNPWDFADVADVPLSNSVAFPYPVTPGQLHARSAPPAQGDPQLFLLAGERGTRPIASTRYRYLTFTLGLDHPFSLTGMAGSMARVIWGSRSYFDGNVATVTKDMLVWPGMNTYTIDLAALSQAGNELEPCAAGQECLPWTARSARFLRLDPHEIAAQPVDFYLSSVRLAAPDEVSQGGVFPIQWSLQGASNGTVNLYYDTDTDPAHKQLIVGNLPIGQTTYQWNVGAMPAGDYYVYVEANETTQTGTDTRGAYGSGVLRIIASANNPVLSIASLATGGSAYAPFAINGCAYAGTTGQPSDDVVVYAHPLQGQMGGVVQLLGHNPAGGLGSLSAATCETGGPGYTVSNIHGLPAGLWTFRTVARNSVTGDFDEVQAQNVTISPTSAPARNLRIASISGNTVNVQWDPPGQGTLTQYRIEAAGDPSFRSFTPIVLDPSMTTAGGTLGNGTYYVRVRTGNVYTTEGPTSNVISFTLPYVPGPSGPPGPPTLFAAQVTENPVTLSWAAGPGGPPAQYFVLAGSAPGAANYGTFPMGLATSVSAIAPAGPVYARVVAMNSGGQAVSNEIGFTLSAPAAPTLHPAQISGRDVVFTWTPAAGAPATRYVLVARYAGQSPVILTLPVTGTTVGVPNAPPGSYSVTIVAVNGVGNSAESNAVPVVIH